MDGRIGFGLYQFCGNSGHVLVVVVWVVGVEWVGGLDQGLEVWGGVM